MDATAAERQPSRENPVYVLPAAVSDPDELDRLDEMHHGFQKYFGDDLCAAPIGNSKRILDLGSGSGAWAIQAAQMYPDAEVIAADMTPPPQRLFPSNVRLVHVDLTKDFFETLTPNSYDVVHMRIVLQHVANAVEVLPRVVKLVKPGGWFVVEDLDLMLCSDDSVMGDDTKRFLDILISHMQSKGSDPQIGQKIEGLLKKTGLFSEIIVTKVHSPFSPRQHPDYKVQAVGDTVKRSLVRAFRGLPETVPLLTHDMYDAYKKDVNDPQRAYSIDFYFISAQRSI